MARFQSNQIFLFRTQFGYFVPLGCCFLLFLLLLLFCFVALLLFLCVFEFRVGHLVDFCIPSNGRVTISKNASISRGTGSPGTTKHVIYQNVRYSL